MRYIYLSDTDAAYFDNEITPMDYDFFQSHKDTFKRMWMEQGKEFWVRFVITFRSFSIQYGFVKEFPGKPDQYQHFLDQAFIFIHEQYVDGKFSAAKNLILDIVVVAQNRQALAYLESKSYAKDPFYNKDTRDVFRRLFGPPVEKVSYVKVFFLLPLYVKFGGAVCHTLRKWLDAHECDSSNFDYWKPPTHPDCQPSYKKSDWKTDTCKEIKPKDSSSYAPDSNTDPDFGLYMSERLNGRPTGPCFIKKWTKGDPRFIDSKNPLYEPVACTNSDWRENLDFMKFKKFLDYVDSNFGTGDSCVDSSANNKLHLDNSSSGGKVKKKNKKKKKQPSSCHGNGAESCPSTVSSSKSESITVGTSPITTPRKSSSKSVNVTVGTSAITTPRASSSKSESVTVGTSATTTSTASSNKSESVTVGTSTNTMPRASSSKSESIHIGTATTSRASSDMLENITVSTSITSTTGSSDKGVHVTLGTSTTTKSSTENKSLEFTADSLPDKLFAARPLYSTNCEDDSCRKPSAYIVAVPKSKNRKPTLSRHGDYIQATIPITDENVDALAPHFENTDPNTLIVHDVDNGEEVKFQKSINPETGKLQLSMEKHNADGSVTREMITNLSDLEQSDWVEVPKEPKVEEEDSSVKTSSPPVSSLPFDEKVAREIAAKLPKDFDFEAKPHTAVFKPDDEEGYVTEEYEESFGDGEDEEDAGRNRKNDGTVNVNLTFNTDGPNQEKQCESKKDFLAEIAGLMYPNSSPLKPADHGMTAAVGGTRQEQMRERLRRKHQEKQDLKNKMTTREQNYNRPKSTSPPKIGPKYSSASNIGPKSSSISSHGPKHINVSCGSPKQKPDRMEMSFMNDSSSTPCHTSGQTCPANTTGDGYHHVMRVRVKMDQNDPKNTDGKQEKQYCCTRCVNCGQEIHPVVVGGSVPFIPKIETKEADDGSVVVAINAKRAPPDMPVEDIRLDLNKICQNKQREEASPPNLQKKFASEQRNKIREQEMRRKHMEFFPAHERKEDLPPDDPANMDLDWEPVKSHFMNRLESQEGDKSRQLETFVDFHKAMCEKYEPPSYLRGRPRKDPVLELIEKHAEEDQFRDNLRAQEMLEKKIERKMSYERMTDKIKRKENELREYKFRHLEKLKREKRGMDPEDIAIHMDLYNSLAGGGSKSIKKDGSDSEEDKQKTRNKWDKTQSESIKLERPRFKSNDLEKNSLSDDMASIKRTNVNVNENKFKLQETKENVPGENSENNSDKENKLVPNLEKFKLDSCTSVADRKSSFESLSPSAKSAKSPSLDSNSDTALDKGLTANNNEEKEPTKLKERADLKKNEAVSGSSESSMQMKMSSSPQKTLRVCSKCLKPEPTPKAYRKCQKCKQQGIKNARYYCGKDCQVEDWSEKHKREHKENLLT